MAGKDDILIKVGAEMDRSLAEVIAYTIRELRKIEQKHRDVQSATKKHNRAVKQAEKTIRRYSEQLRTMNGQLRQAGNLIETKLIYGFAAATAAITAFGVSTVKTGAEFEQSMINVGAIANLTSGQVDRLSKRARELGASTAYTATEVANGMGDLARAGLDVVKIMGAIEPTLYLAGAAGADMSVATKMMARTFAQFNLQAKDAATVADVFTVAMQNSLLDIESLDTSMRYAGAGAGAFGMDIKDTTAAVALFMDQTGLGSTAGTQFRHVLLSLAGPTARAEEVMGRLAKMHNKLNGTTSETAKTIKDKLSPANSSFKEIIETLIPVMNDNEAILALVNKRASGSLQKIIKDFASGSSKYEGLVKKMDLQVGQAQKTYLRQINGVMGQAKILRSKIEETQLAIFDTFKVNFKEFVTGIGGAFDVVSEAFIKNKNVIQFYVKQAIDPLLTALANIGGEGESATDAITKGAVKAIFVLQRIAKIVFKLIKNSRLILKVVIGIWTAAKFSTIINGIIAVTKATYGLVGALGLVGGKLKIINALVTTVTAGLVALGVMKATKAFDDATSVKVDMEGITEELENQLALAKEINNTFKTGMFGKGGKAISQNFTELKRVTDHILSEGYTSPISPKLEELPGFTEKRKEDLVTLLTEQMSMSASDIQEAFASGELMLGKQVESLLKKAGISEESAAFGLAESLRDQGLSLKTVMAALRIDGDEAVKSFEKAITKERTILMAQQMIVERLLKLKNSSISQSKEMQEAAIKDSKNNLDALTSLQYYSNQLEDSLFGEEERDKKDRKFTEQDKALGYNRKSFDLMIDRDLLSKRLDEVSHIFGQFNTKQKEAKVTAVTTAQELAESYDKVGFGVEGQSKVFENLATQIRLPLEILKGQLEGMDNVSPTAMQQFNDLSAALISLGSSATLSASDFRGTFKGLLEELDETGQGFDTYLGKLRASDAAAASSALVQSSLNLEMKNGKISKVEQANATERVNTRIQLMIALQNMLIKKYPVLNGLIDLSSSAFGGQADNMTALLVAAGKTGKGLTDVNVDAENKAKEIRRKRASAQKRLTRLLEKLEDDLAKARAKGTQKLTRQVNLRIKQIKREFDTAIKLYRRFSAAERRLQKDQARAMSLAREIGLANMVKEGEKRTKKLQEKAKKAGNTELQNLKGQFQNELDQEKDFHKQSLHLLKDSGGAQHKEVVDNLKLTEDMALKQLRKSNPKSIKIYEERRDEIIEIVKQIARLDYANEKEGVDNRKEAAELVSKLQKKRSDQAITLGNLERKARRKQTKKAIQELKRQNLTEKRIMQQAHYDSEKLVVEGEKNAEKEKQARDKLINKRKIAALERFHEETINIIDKANKLEFRSQMASLDFDQKIARQKFKVRVGEGVALTLFDEKQASERTMVARKLANELLNISGVFGAKDLTLVKDYTDKTLEIRKHAASGYVDIVRFVGRLIGSEELANFYKSRETHAAYLSDLAKMQTRHLQEQEEIAALNDADARKRLIKKHEVEQKELAAQHFGALGKYFGRYATYVQGFVGAVTITFSVLSKAISGFFNIATDSLESVINKLKQVMSFATGGNLELNPFTLMTESANSLLSKQEEVKQKQDELDEQFRAGRISREERARGVVAEEVDPAAEGRRIVDEMIDKALNFLNFLVDTAPAIFDRLAERLPELITAFAEKIPELMAIIAEKLPVLLPLLIELFKQVIIGIAQNLAPIIKALVEALPDIIDAFVEALPFIIDALVTILRSPEFWQSISQAFVKAVIAVLSGIGEFLYKLIFGFGNGMDSSVQSYNDTPGPISVRDNAGMLARFARGDTVVAAKEPVELLRQSLQAVGQSAGRAARGTPPSSGLGDASFTSKQNIDIAVMAEGRVLDAIQVQAMNRGHAPKISKKLRKASGVTIGFNRGRFNRFAS